MAIFQSYFFNTLLSVFEYDEIIIPDQPPAKGGRNAISSPVTFESNETNSLF